MLTDCQSLVDNCRNLRIRAEERRLLGEITSLKEAIHSGEVRSLSHIGTEFMVADALTKSTPRRRRQLLDAMAGTIILPTTSPNSKKTVEHNRSK